MHLTIWLILDQMHRQSCHSNIGAIACQILRLAVCQIDLENPLSTFAEKNVRGIALMIISMAFFAGTDVFVKLASGTMSPAHTTLFLMGGGGVIFAVLAKSQGEVLFSRGAFAPILLVRYVTEMMGAFGIVLALATAPLSTVGAIIQATPLVVTVGAVVFLDERVSWRQWAAIAVGFCGVLLIIQPGADGFQVSVLWALVAMVGLSGRDLTTRLTPAGMASSRLATYTMAAAMPFAIFWCLSTQGSLIPADPNWGYVVAMIGFGAVGYLLLIASIRSTAVSIVSPFRYSRLIFLLFLGVFLFEERPTPMILLGAALIVASGIYTMWQSHRS
jgi:drug/metabolite transporter (DMT)-like permease